MANITATRTSERDARMRRTAEGVAAAHDAFLERSIANTRWERRGLLRRLVRVG